MNDTKTRILDAAERLFALHGFEAASLRAITTEARVNLAAVNYHFQSKDGLIDAIVARHLEPINRQRLARLDACEAAAGKRPMELERIMDAFFAPVFDSPLDGREFFMPLVGRLFTAPEEFLHHVFEKHLSAVARRFDAALSRSLPHLAPVERAWRQSFGIGAMTHTLLLARAIPVVTHGVCDLTDGRALTRRMVAFVCAGLRAPATEIASKTRPARKTRKAGV
ncbi:MAG: TetR/AcrR family transcriptional regulator [Bryobacteraceae bacterium]